ncbi:hypothetical protein AL485_23315 [Serratia liquefaciens]|uniref:hypothetical protein n=1 Tax=Serratia liquefaciens TaxID=614 RepID=UPI00076AFB0E|nr:hypothetical protein [Serratia liquefaciens]AMH01851.1 hypothetical protein AL485_23315 [Serratia liquefaciens]
MKYVYMVLDSRAQYDTDAAAVLECCGEGKQPSMRTLSRDWGEQGAVLVRYEKINDTEFGNETVVGVIP